MNVWFTMHNWPRKGEPVAEPLLHARHAATVDDAVAEIDAILARFPWSSVCVGTPLTHETLARRREKSEFGVVMASLGFPTSQVAR